MLVNIFAGLCKKNCSFEGYRTAGRPQQGSEKVAVGPPVTVVHLRSWSIRATKHMYIYIYVIYIYIYIYIYTHTHTNTSHIASKPILSRLVKAPAVLGFSTRNQRWRHKKLWRAFRGLPPAHPGMRTVASSLLGPGAVQLRK